MKEEYLYLIISAMTRKHQQDGNKALKESMSQEKEKEVLLKLLIVSK